MIPAPEPGSLSWGATATVAAFLGLLAFTVYRTTAGRIPSISGRARVAEQGEHVITFKDVAGVDEAKDEVKEIVDFLREPDRFGAIGGRIPKGVLLVGPPGTGKTLLARSIAGEAGVPFLFASGSDFVEMYAGVGARASAACSRMPAATPRASSSSTSSTPSAAAVAAARSATRSASRPSTSCWSKWTASRPITASSSLPPPTVPTSSIRRCCGRAGSTGR